MSTKPDLRPFDLRPQVVLADGEAPDLRVDAFDAAHQAQVEA
ncbi:hypothetical protein [Phenylobacterium sp.]|nr:hypothetical protein [Phenylobacterium sp.]